MDAGDERGWSACCVDAQQTVPGNQNKADLTTSEFFCKYNCVMRNVCHPPTFVQIKLNPCCPNDYYVMPRCWRHMSSLSMWICWSRCCIAKATILWFGPSVWTSWRRTRSIMRRYGTLGQWITNLPNAFVFVSFRPKWFLLRYFGIPLLSLCYLCCSLLKGTLRHTCPSFRTHR